MNTNIDKNIRLAAGRAGRRFNSLSIRVKKIILTIGGLSVAIICGLVTFEKILPGQSHWLRPAPITVPIDTRPDSVMQKVQTPAALDK